VHLLAPLTRRLYYPGHHLRAATRPASASTTYALRRGSVTLRGWTAGSGPDALVWFGGNAEDVGARAERLASTLPGRTSYLVAYRGYGASDGRPSERALVDDGLALVREVATRHPRVAVVGRSLGSGVAVQVASRLGCDPATRDLVDALVLVTPFDSVRSMVRHHAGGLPLDVLLGDHFRSDLHVGAVTAPVTVVRAGRDVVVPPASTDRLVRLLPPGARVVDLPERDHADVIAADETWDAIARAVEGVERP
jgi:uncharacterized protein